MIIFAWNCRGLGQASAIRDLRALIQSSKPDCLILMETKVNEASIIRILRNLGFSNHNIISLLAERFAGAWLLLGDFNGICNREDRSTNRGLDGGSRIMREALDNEGMISIPSSGFFYTWSNRRGGRQQVNSRIDRGVANEEWWTRFPNANLQLLPQTTSDHHPQLLSCFGQNSDTKQPFRFEAAWVEDCHSHWVVNHAWFGNIQANIKATRAALAFTQQNVNNQSNLDYDRNLRCHLDHLLNMEETLWFQKSRLKWQLDGDRCTRFFFLTTLTRRKFNRIDYIKSDDGQWLTSRDQIGQAFLQRFIATYDEPNHATIDLNHSIYPAISEVDNASLITIPDWDEIRATVFRLGSFKATGLDGFPALFFKSYWDIVGEDVVLMVRDFFITGSLHPNINSTNLVLIPKTKNPSTINHFRPIAVCNIVYKVISKILAERLKPLLSRLICPTQGAFVPGRSIHDNSVIIQEVVHALKRKKGFKGWMGLKIDLQKAYDILSWQFLGKVLKAFGFHPIWIHRISRHTPAIHHLFFADDVFLLGKCTFNEASQFKECLDTFCLWSGQSFNASKSNIFFSNLANKRVAGRITELMGFSRIAPNSVYLGLPLFRSGKSSDFDYLIEQLDSNLVGWKSRVLSKAKRLVLVQSIVLALPIYTMQTAKIPASVCSKLDRCIRSFWWGISPNGGKSLCLKAWDAVCKPKSCGGLGFRHMKDFNTAILTNWG
ncbi:hypothetical protein UlMin_002735 [Ulmus minor]